MTSPKTRGYVFAIMQFSMGGIIILLSFIERNIFNRTQISIVRYISYILIFLCIVTMLTAFIQYGQYITPNPVPRDSTVLRTNGIYSVIRHPMYMGALVGLVGRMGAA